MSRKSQISIVMVLAALMLIGFGPSETLFSQDRFKAPATILDDATLKLILEEVSGQIAFNNEAMMAGYNRIRTPEEMTGLMYEADYLSKVLKSYGLDEVTVESLKLPGRATWWVGQDAELSMVAPEKRLLARLVEQPALIIRGSDSVDCEGELVYIDQRDVSKYMATDFTGKIILTPEYPGYFAKVFEKGALGIISYQNSIDPMGNVDQVTFDMSFDKGGFKGKAFGFRISAREGIKLRDMIFQGRKVVVHARTNTAEYPWKADTVFAAIRGTSPEKKGLMFTAHLFERPAKIGANDNVSGCAVLAEIARVITTLIKNGKIPRPERSIYFLMSEEGSGTAAYFKSHPEMAQKILGDINMDMVGESLDANSAFFYIEEPLYAKTTYLNSVARNFAEYVQRTNVERHGVYLPNPLERFPVPIVEKNGSRESFRYTMQRFGGGSDHMLFVESDADTPALHMIVWPDKWYHTDQDTPDKSDPTQLKRVAFIGTCSALAVASGVPVVLENLILETYRDRQVFMLEAYQRAATGISSRSTADGGRAWRDGFNNVTQSVHLTRTALGSIRELAAGKPEVSNYLEGVINAARQHLPAYTAELKIWYALSSERRGLKPDEYQPTADDKAALGIVPVKLKKIALGDFMPLSELFGAFNKDPKLQMLAYTKVSAQGLMEMLILMDGSRNLAQIRDLLSFEFEPVEMTDLLQIARALESANLIKLDGAK